MTGISAETQRLIGMLRAAAQANPSPIQAMMDEARRGLPADDLNWMMGCERAEPVKSETRTRKRRPTVASLIRQIKRAGVEVAGFEINPRDGTVKVIPGKPVGDVEVTDAAPIDRSEWN